jgi:hypothetical protein
MFYLCPLKSETAVGDGRVKKEIPHIDRLCTILFILMWCMYAHVQRKSVSFKLTGCLFITENPPRYN